MLNRHIKIHDEAKAFKCDLCFKIFSNKNDLKQHYRTHTGEKPFACQNRGEKFAIKKALVKHQATHSSYSNQYSFFQEGRF